MRRLALSNPSASSSVPFWHSLPATGAPCSGRTCSSSRTGSTVGTSDPIIGKDIGFYLFSLPLLEMLKAFAGFMLLATTVMVAAVYYVRGGITLTERGAAVDEKVRKHLAVLVGIFSPA